MEKAFSAADDVFTGQYSTQRVQHVHLEPHVCITWWDENQRLVIRTSTQVTYHVRRIVAPLIGLPIKRIRVIKPRIGGGFGNKQEMILEDLCAHLTLATGRPVRMELTRDQEFSSTRSRHPEIMRYKVGVKDGKITAADLYMVSDTGAYGTHGATSPRWVGCAGDALQSPQRALSCDVVIPTTRFRRFRGYGTCSACTH